MNRFILLGLSIFIFSGIFVFAQEDSTQEERQTRTIQKREEIKNLMLEKKAEVQSEIMQKREEVRATILEKKEAQKTRLQENAQKRVLKVVGKVFERFDAVIIKFDGITERIESRITKLEEKGIDVSEAKIALANARANITESTTLILATKEEIEVLVGQESSKETLRALVAKAKESLKESKKSLLEIVPILEASKK